MVKNIIIAEVNPLYRPAIKPALECLEVSEKFFAIYAGFGLD